MFIFEECSDEHGLWISEPIRWSTSQTLSTDDSRYHPEICFIFEHPKYLPEENCWSMPLPTVAEDKNGASKKDSSNVDGGGLTGSILDVAPPLQENLHPNHVLFKKVRPI